MVPLEFQRSENPSRSAISYLPYLSWVFSGLVVVIPSPVSARDAGATAAFPPASVTPAALRAPPATFTAATTPAAAAARVAAVPPPSSTAPAPSPYEMPVPAQPPGEARAAESDPTFDRRDAPERARDRRAEAWLLALEGYTTVPVDLGARVTFETPFRLRLSGGYGVVPGAYFGIVNDAVEESGAYESLAADLVEASLDDGHVWRAMIGFRPVGGLYFDTGYARIALSGGLQADQFGYSIDTTLHMWTAEVGFQGAVADHLLLALGIGMMKTFEADSTVAANFDLGRSNTVRRVTDEAVEEYDRKLQQYGIVPTLTLRAGWDFF